MTLNEAKLVAKSAGYLVETWETQRVVNDYEGLKGEVKSRLARILQEIKVTYDLMSHLSASLNTEEWDDIQSTIGDAELDIKKALAAC